MWITVAGSSGKQYVICFEGVSSMESESPEGMMLYALNEAVGESEPMRRDEFVNWYGDEPSDERARLIRGSSLSALPSPCSPLIDRASIVSGPCMVALSSKWINPIPLLQLQRYSGMGFLRVTPMLE
jgi:hypothetical protein